jgi:hypothetical protein
MKSAFIFIPEPPILAVVLAGVGVPIPAVKNETETSKDIRPTTCPFFGFVDVEKKIDKSGPENPGIGHDQEQDEWKHPHD